MRPPYKWRNLSMNVHSCARWSPLAIYFATHHMCWNSWPLCLTHRCIASSLPGQVSPSSACTSGSGQTNGRAGIAFEKRGAPTKGRGVIVITFSHHSLDEMYHQPMHVRLKTPSRHRERYIKYDALHMRYIMPWHFRKTISTAPLQITISYAPDTQRTHHIPLYAPLFVKKIKSDIWHDMRRSI